MTMASISSWFSARSSETHNEKLTPAQAVAQIKDWRDELDKKEREYEGKIAVHKAQAVKLAKEGKRTRALHVLRLCRKIQTVIDFNAEIQLKMEFLILRIEEADMANQTSRVLNGTRTALGLAVSDTKLKELDKTIDELNALLGIANDITSTMSSAEMGDHVDEDELAAELARLMSQDDPDRTGGSAPPSALTTPRQAHYSSSSSSSSASVAASLAMPSVPDSAMPPIRLRHPGLLADD